jgi:hypothetical protein
MAVMIAALGRVCGCRQGCPIEVARQRGRGLRKPLHARPSLMVHR